MPFKKILIITSIAAALVAGALQVNAQPTTTKTAKPAKLTPKIVLLPDFFHYEKVMSGDTAYSYECYDEKEQKINVNEISDAKGISDIYYFKSYYGAARKPGSPISPPYLSAKLCIYERTGDASWASNNLVKREKNGIKEFVKTIVRKDTVYITKPESNVKQMVIHKYYKTERVAIDAVPNTHTHSHAH